MKTLSLLLLVAVAGFAPAADIGSPIPMPAAETAAACPCGPACPLGGGCGAACPCGATKAALGTLTTTPARAAVRVSYFKDSPGWGGTAVSPTKVVTCAHGLSAGGGVTVHQGGKSLPATVGRYDPAADVAVLEVAQGGLTYAAVGNDPMPGTPVEMHGAGDAGGAALTRKAGVVTGTLPWRGPPSDPVTGHLMTRSTVVSVPGDSGAGIFAAGKLVAVNSGGSGDSLGSRAADIRGVVGTVSSPYGPDYTMQSVPGVGAAWTHRDVAARIKATGQPGPVAVEYPTPGPDDPPFDPTPVAPGVQSYSGQESLDAFEKCPDRGSVEGYYTWLGANPEKALTATPRAGSVCGPNGCGTGQAFNYGSAPALTGTCGPGGCGQPAYLPFAAQTPISPPAIYPQGSSCGPNGCGVQQGSYGNPFANPLQGNCPGGVCPAPQTQRRGLFR